MKLWESFDHQTVSELMFFYRDVGALLADDEENETQSDDADS